MEKVRQTVRHEQSLPLSNDGPTWVQQTRGAKHCPLNVKVNFKLLKELAKGSRALQFCSQSAGFSHFLFWIVIRSVELGTLKSC